MGELVDVSPVLMMRAVREARMLLNLERRTPRNINVDYTFIDVAHDTIVYLRNYLDAKQQENAVDLIDYNHAEIIHSQFLPALPAIINKIKQRKMGEHAIFMLDQYSYKDIPLQAIAKILHSITAAEIIMTLNVDNLTTYLADCAGNRKPIENIGLNQYMPWDKIRELKATHRQE